MTTTEIAKLLAGRAEEVARLFFPNGKRSGNAWLVGSLSGEAGNSLSVLLSGEKAGVWKDFAGDPDDTGDMIGLWCRVKGVDVREARKQAVAFLGIEEKAPALMRPPTPAKVFKRPALAGIEPLQSGGEAGTYLIGERKLELAMLDRYGVKQFASPQHGPAIVFPITNPAGVTVCLKYLAVKRAPDGKKTIWSSADSEDRLFGWRGIEPDAREVVITEGEIDALTVAGWRLPALSLPRGVEAMAWIENDWEDLAPFDKIYLCFDSDAAGQKAVEAVALRLGRERCYRVSLPAKDANAALLAGMDGQSFRQCLASASGFDPDTLKGAARFTDEVLTHEFAAVTNPTGTPAPWNIPFRVRDGELTIITGFSGAGKSLAWSHLIACDLAAGQPCCIASLEIKPRKTLWILARQLLGFTPKDAGPVREAMAWMDGKVWLFDSGGSAPPAKIFEAFSYAARRYGVKRFVIDSLLFCGFAEDDYNGQKQFAEACKVFAEKHDCHLYLVCHSRKKEDESGTPGKFDVRGGAAMTDACFNGISIWRNLAKADAIVDAETSDAKVRAASMPDGGIKIWKQRETGELPSIALWLHHDSGQFHEKQGQYGIRYATP